MPVTTGPGAAPSSPIPEDLSPSAFAKLFTLTPEGAAQYLQGRQRLTQTFDWRELWQEEHATQFTVSRLARLDLLQAIQEGITQSVGGDLTRRDFTRNVTKLLQDAGWWGTVEVMDPSTGELLTTRFDPNRVKLIYDMNTRMAHSAGRWERIQAAKATHPYLRYITKDDARVRASHAAWHNLTLPVDDPWWQTHYPPNGWRCRCRVISLTQAEYDAGQSPTGEPLKKTAPDSETVRWLDKRTGELHEVPAGIDPGFAYNVGEARARARGLAQVEAAKLASAAPPLVQAAQQAGMRIQEPNAMPTRTPWGDFPDVVIQASESAVKQHPNYAAAKAGELAPALRLVQSVWPEDTLAHLRDLAGADLPRLVAVHAVEGQSVNVIPLAMAAYLEQRLGWSVVPDIIQTNRVSHTGANGFYRLAHPALFAGPVMPGADYVLLDDFIGQGGTLANLRGHITAGGGRVIAATALTGKPYSATLSLTADTLSKLRAKHGQLEDWWRQRFGYGFELLTESEARYLERSADADAIRAGLAAGAPAGRAR